MAEGAGTESRVNIAEGMAEGEGAESKVNMAEGEGTECT